MLILISHSKEFERGKQLLISETGGEVESGSLILA
jgi:hypothetical protein